MKAYSFTSSDGYNTQVKLGKIYIFSKACLASKPVATNKTLKYLLEVNKDLIVNSAIIKYKFMNHVYKYPTKQKFFEKYKLPQDLFLRELGLINFNI